MNKRFQQILKQSTNPPWDGEQGPMNEFNLEKCFELIVKECALQCVHNEDMDLIEKHFGVEE